MLKILDRYIIKKFLSTFFFMLGIIMLLAMVFDLAERLSEFIANEASFYDIAVNYYLNFILFYGNMFSSMIVFISVIWFTAKMAQETEIIPILNSGKPFTRFIRPYMIGATILMLISLVLNHFVIPKSNQVRLDFEEKYYRVDMVVENYQAEFPKKHFVHYKTFIATNKLFSDFQIEQYNSKGQIIRFLKARGAIGNEKNNKWKLQDVFIRELTPPAQNLNAIGEKELSFIPDKLTELKSLDTTFNFGMKDLAVRDNIVETMNFTDLKQFIAAEKEKGNAKVPQFEIELHQRTSYPFATYVLTLIGLSVASRKKRGGIGINLAIGFIFVFIYIFAMKITTVAAIKVGFPTLLAVWLPNFIFGLIALFMYRLAPK